MTIHTSDIYLLKGLLLYTSCTATHSIYHLQGNIIIYLGEGVYNITRVI